MDNPERIPCGGCGIPITPNDDMLCNACHDAREAYWEASLDTSDPDNFWIDDATGERVNAVTGERTKITDS